MNINKFTIKSQEAIQLSQQLAQGLGQQQIENEHIFKAIFEVDENVAPFILKKLNVNVPLFNSGLTQGNVMQAKAVAKEDKLKYAQALRKARLAINDAYIILTSDQRRMQAFAKAVDAAQKNYDLQAVDYGNNSVNNLDVLQGLEDLQSVKDSYVSLKNETQRAYWVFKASIGEISDDTN